MSLSGRIEDLPLLDIIQIVAFTQRTGYIRVETDDGLGAIVFRAGKVVACFAPGAAVRIPRADLNAAEWQRALSDLIARDLGVMSRLREGNFGFVLSPEVPRAIEGHDLSHETLDYGLDAQEVLMDLAREMDEDRRDTVSALQAPETAPARERKTGEFSRPASGPPPSMAVLLVEDELDVRGVLAARLQGAGLVQIAEASTFDEAFRLADRFDRRGDKFLAIVDLSIPDQNGVTLDGGLDLVARLSRLRRMENAILITPNPNPLIVKSARQAGASRVVFRPTLARLDPDMFASHLSAFCDKLDVVVAECLGAKTGPPAVSGASALGLIDALDLLDRIEEPASVRDLILRVAAGAAERAILFVRTAEGLSPTAGVGFPLGQMGADIVVQESHPAIAEALSSKGITGFVTDRSFWEALEPAAVPKFRSFEAAFIPLRTHHETVALLFVDNPLSGEALGRLDGLAGFVQEAGMRMEDLRRRPATAGKG
jgi:CheY-like chemotaxis protein